jgi:hypothetical protein
MRRPLARAAATAGGVLALLLSVAAPAAATPVCTDGYKGGPPASLCDGRVFPEVSRSVDYVQYSENPADGFSEYVHGLEYLAQKYPRWVSVQTFRQRFQDDDAVSAGPDGTRSTDPADSGDGRDILVVKITDHEVPDAGKETLLFSLSVHGDEKGGIEGGLRTAEDLAIAAEDGGTIVDGVEGYESATGQEPAFHEYEVKDVLAKEAVYLVDFNIDGLVAGDLFTDSPGPLYTRANEEGTDLNRQMPTVGYINPNRNPLQESEMAFGHRLMQEVAEAGVGGKMAYGADVHGEGQSRAWADIMYPAGQFDSVRHRQLMAIAERTKSVIDDTLYLGVADMIEEQTGGDLGEGIEDYGAPSNLVPTKPARWGTVWDTLGYTDTGFIGDYLATELGVTGMDYEIALNHSDATRPYGRPWGLLFQENYVNATRAIIKTAMAYALTQSQEFEGWSLDPNGRVGYVLDPRVVTDADGAGRLPGPQGDGVGQDGQEVAQRPYSATQMNWFRDSAKYVKGGLTPVPAASVADGASSLDRFDTLVLADDPTPPSSDGRTYDSAAYLASLKAWVERGGNLVLTDRALHVLEGMAVVPAGAVSDVKVYQPYADFADRSHPMAKGLRGNARQLAEFTLIGYPIGNTASPMSVVDQAAWTTAGGAVVGTTGANRVSVGELPLGSGKVRILGGGLGTPSEEFDHRYGLKDYALTYTGLFLLENSLVHDAPGMGVSAPAATSDSPVARLPIGIAGLPLLLALAVRRHRRGGPRPPRPTAVVVGPRPAAAC